MVSVRVQLRVVYALLLREIITRYGRHGLGFLWLFIEPMLFTLGVAGLWYFAGMHILSDIPIVAFAITGYSTVLMWRNVASRCSKAIEPNLALLYHRNVKIIDIFLARIVLEWVGSTFSLIILTIIFIGFGAMSAPTDIWLAIIGWFLLAWFSLALGLIVGSISELSDAFERTWHIIVYLLFPLSGAVYMLEWMPVYARDVLKWLPMVHAVEMIRHGYFGDIVKTHERIDYLIISNIMLTYLGLVLIRIIERRVQPE